MHLIFFHNTNKKMLLCYEREGKQFLLSATNGIDTGLNKQLKFRSKRILLLFKYFENLKTHLFPYNVHSLGETSCTSIFPQYRLFVPSNENLQKINCSPPLFSRQRNVLREPFSDNKNLRPTYFF